MPDEQTEDTEMDLDDFFGEEVTAAIDKRIAASQQPQRQSQQSQKREATVPYDKQQQDDLEDKALDAILDGDDAEVKRIGNEMRVKRERHLSDVAEGRIGMDGSKPSGGMGGVGMGN